MGPLTSGPTPAGGESVPQSTTTNPALSSTARLLSSARRRSDGAWEVNGQPPMNDDAFKALVERHVTTDLMTGDTIEGLQPYLEQAGIQFSSTGGTFRVTGLPNAGGVSVGGATATGGSAAASPSPATSGSGGSYAGGGVPIGGGGGGSAGYSYRGGAGDGWGGGGGAPAATSVSLPGGSTGATQIDPNAPLGLDPRGGAPAGPRGGTYGADVFAGPGSVLEGIGPGSTLNDVMMNVVKRQEANRDAALRTYGGAYREAKDDPVLQGARGRALDVLANPFSLDDDTVARILGKQADTIGQNFNRLKGMAADRAAASGVGRSGLAAAEQDRLDINAVKSLGDAQRGLLVEQATRRPRELQASLASAGDFGYRDVGQRTGIATGAADHVYGQTSILGDALLSGVLMGGGPPAINVASPYQGYLLSGSSATRRY